MNVFGILLFVLHNSFILNSKLFFHCSQILVDDITIKYEGFDKAMVGAENADFGVSLNTPITIEECSPGSSRNLQASFFLFKLISHVFRLKNIGHYYALPDFFELLWFLCGKWTILRLFC